MMSALLVWIYRKPARQSKQQLSEASNGFCETIIRHEHMTERPKIAHAESTGDS
jgi:hypothetical protein